jgi:hypothetical protein
MPFQQTREAALQLWLAGTNRVRDEGSDNFSDGYECTWQNKFQPYVEGNTDHYSIFCSLGEFSTNLTDILEDIQYDKRQFDNEQDQQVLYRHYTRTFLFASEIITDFQDILTGLRLGNRPTGNQLSHGKGQSRIELNTGLPADTINNMFNYINNVFKHKVNNIHICNHHLPIHFEDSGTVFGYAHPVSVGTINTFIQQNNIQAGTIPTHDSVEVPSLVRLIEIVLNCYRVVDNAFRADRQRFHAYANLYLGQTPQVTPVAGQADNGNGAPAQPPTANITP